MNVILVLPPAVLTATAFICARMEAVAKNITFNRSFAPYSSDTEN
jgi:hypothetical protein